MIGMRFRFKAFGAHLLCSCTALGLVLGGLYAGWYLWPGWYLTGVAAVVAVMAGVDVVLGPLLTLVVASPDKPRRVLARDIGLIGAVQLIALIYGTAQLWHGRPLYYAFSENCMTIVQAYDIDQDALAEARRQKSPLLPHFYSLPRWIWAPLPGDAEQADKIVQSAISGGFDVTARPQYYRPWRDGLGELREQLKPVDDIKFFSLKEKNLLKERMKAAGFSPEKATGIAFTGRSRPLLAVVDPSNSRILALIQAT
jgi:hypothetical protein